MKAGLKLIEAGLKIAVLSIGYFAITNETMAILQKSQFESTNSCHFFYFKWGAKLSITNTVPPKKEYTLNS